MLIDPHKRIDLVHTVGGGIELLAPDVAGAMDDLALQVGEVHYVEIDQPDASDTGGGQIQTQRRAKPAGSHQKNFGGLQLELTFGADFGHDQVPAVAQDLVLCESL